MSLLELFHRRSLDCDERAHRLVETLVLRSSRKFELLVASVRIVFVLVLAVRFFTVNDFGSADARSRFWIEAPILAVSLAVAIVMGLWVLRGDITSRYLVVSVVVDASIASSTLLAGVLSPWPLYESLLHTPDIALVPTLCLSAGLRLSTKAALVGSSANMLLFAGLVALDLQRNVQPAASSLHEAQLYFLYLAACSAVGLGVAYRAVALATAAATHAERAEQARAGLTRVLQDHHDVGSLLSSARINADLIGRAHRGTSDSGLARASAALRGDLDDLTEIVGGSRDQAYIELAATSPASAVDVRETLLRVTESVRRRFPALNVSLDVSAPSDKVTLPDGERGLERVILNLLVNAAEGSGEQAARNVVLSTRASARSYEIRIQDDGPGFPEQVLERAAERFTTKVRGSGFGLGLVRRIVEHAGGTLYLENLPERGARVRILLPQRTSGDS